MKMLTSTEDTYVRGRLVKVNLKVETPCTLKNTPLNFIREIMKLESCTSSQALVILNLAGGDLGKIRFRHQKSSSSQY